MIATLAQNIGKGLVAGLAGTAAMTVSSTVEMKVRRREASSAPAKAAERVLGIKEFESASAEKIFGTLVHWGYGTGWGAVRGILRALGVPAATATALHYSVVWGGEGVMLPVLDVAPPITMWGGKEIAIDVWHHIVYVVATAIAYEALDR
jgi:hypothetical protein